jgi:hypothetical protein
MRLRLLIPAFGLTLAAALGGCTDSRSGTMLVSPARFTLYNCQELAAHQAGLVSRQRQLEDLMAKANREAAGRIVSAAAYQPEYQTVLGEMKVLRQEAVQKDCKLPDPYAPPPVTAKPAKPAKPKR